MLDEFGLAQPAFRSPIILGQRVGSFTDPANGVNSLYLEVALPGILWAPGLPIPYRDNINRIRLARPDLLSSPYSIKVEAWGTWATATSGALSVTIGTNTVMTVAAGVGSAGAFVVTVYISPIGTTGTSMVAVGALTGTAITTPGARTVTTLTQAMTTSQTLGIRFNVAAADSGTLDGAVVYLIPSLPYPTTDSTV